MTTIPQVSQAMQHVLTSAAEAADVKLHYTRRADQAKFSASALVQTLVLGWLAQRDATVEQLSQSAARVGVDVTAQAIDQRFTLATAALLQEVLSASMQHLIASDGVAIPILQRFTGVRIHDSTTIVLPDALAELWAGCGGSTAEHTASALKCGVQLDLLSGALSGLDLTDGRASDHRLGVQHARLPKGSLRLADLGFYDLNVLASLSAAEVYWLSKLEPTALISDAGHSDCPLLAFVTGLGEIAQWEGYVWVGRGRRLPGRLLVMRVPQEVADQRRRRPSPPAAGECDRRPGTAFHAGRASSRSWGLIQRAPKTCSERMCVFSTPSLPSVARSPARQRETHTAPAFPHSPPMAPPPAPR